MRQLDPRIYLVTLMRAMHRVDAYQVAVDTQAAVSERPATSRRTVDEVRRSLFDEPNALLCGAWDAMHIQPASATGNARDPGLDARIRYAFGPVHQRITTPSEHAHDAWQAFTNINERPLVAYVEARLSEVALAYGGAWAVDAALRLVRADCEAKGVDHLLFVGLGHADLVAVLGGKNLKSLLDVVLTARARTIGELCDTPTGGAVPGGRATLHQQWSSNHLFMSTSTSIGFYCGSYSAFEQVADKLAEDTISLFPSLRCTLHTGHEQYASEITKAIQEATAEQDAPAITPVVEITTGAFDFRISYPATANRSQRSVFRWFSKVFRILLGEAGSGRGHVRSVHTTWGQRLTDTSDRRLGRHPTPPKVLRRMSSKEKNVDILADLELLLEPLARSDAFAAYLADVWPFFDALRSIETDVDRSLRSDHDLQTMARRMMFVLLGRLVGATAWGEDLVLGHATGTQKIALSLGAIAEAVIDAFHDEPNKRPIALVGLASLRKDRSTVYGARGERQLALIELSIDRDVELRSVLLRLLHEVSHVIEMPVDLRSAFEEALQRDVAARAVALLREKGASVVEEARAVDHFVKGDREQLRAACDVSGLLSLLDAQTFAREDVTMLDSVSRELHQFLKQSQRLASEWRADARVFALVGQPYVTFMWATHGELKTLEATQRLAMVDYLHGTARNETSPDNTWRYLRAWTSVFFQRSREQLELAGSGRAAQSLSHVRTLVANRDMRKEDIDALLNLTAGRFVSAFSALFA